VSIIESLMAEIKSNETDEQVKEICDKIFEEEQGKIKSIDSIPIGPNIFLSLEVKANSDEIARFICLEREASKTYIVTTWIKRTEGGVAHRIRAKECKFDDTKRIMRFYAENVKFINGE